MAHKLKQGCGTEAVPNPNQSRIVIPCRPRYDLLENTYRKNQLIVFFDQPPTDDDTAEVKQYLKEDHNIKDIDNVQIKQCGDGCGLAVQLWEAKDIHTVISGAPVKGGGGGGTGTVGDNYSLNFLSKIPPQNKINLTTAGDGGTKSLIYQEDLIIIAVLDTGVDRTFVNEKYIGNNLENKDSSPCFKDSKSGRNFVDNGNDKNNTYDDNDHKHGTLVTQYIIKQFEKKQNDRLQIIPVKTHDQKGQGDLFSIYCGIKYAIAKGANIINASWGFYYYESTNAGTVNLLNMLMEELREEGILFITAAGNESAQEDQIATGIYEAQTGGNPDPKVLRDLDTNPFYPACLSEGNQNVITVTTADGDKVASTENYSAIFVDLGVQGDDDNGRRIRFRIPYLAVGGAPTFIGGSSFATAIASGIIGANCERDLYNKNTIDRASFIYSLRTKKLLKKNRQLSKQIRNGAYIES